MSRSLAEELYSHAYSLMTLAQALDGTPAAGLEHGELASAVFLQARTLRKLAAKAEGKVLVPVAYGHAHQDGGTVRASLPKRIGGRRLDAFLGDGATGVEALANLQAAIDREEALAAALAPQGDETNGSAHRDSQ